MSVDDVDPVGLQTTQVVGDTVPSRASRVTVGDSDTESFDSMPDEEPQSPESGEAEDEAATPVTLQFGAAARSRKTGQGQFGGRVHHQNLCHEESPGVREGSIQGSHAVRTC